MKRPTQLPLITFRGKQWYVDVRLGELRLKDELTPLSFKELEETATPLEMITIAGAICDYYHSLDQ